MKQQRPQNYYYLESKEDVHTKVPKEIEALELKESHHKDKKSEKKEAKKEEKSSQKSNKKHQKETTGLSRPPSDV